jgi:hypothetical protein
MLFNRRNLLSAAGLAASLGFARAAGPAPRPTSAPEVWARTELYFGTSKPNNEQVSEAEFNVFVDHQVTPRFPDGLTLLSGYGQFRTSTGTLVRERSYVLILLYPPQVQDANRRIQELREIYKDSFSQESVLRVDSFSFVSF